MDIADDKRDQVIEWAKQRFGDENVKSVGTWGTYQAKAAVLGTLKTSEKFKKQKNNVATTHYVDKHIDELINNKNEN